MKEGISSNLSKVLERMTSSSRSLVRANALSGMLICSSMPYTLDAHPQFDCEASVGTFHLDHLHDDTDLLSLVVEHRLVDHLIGCIEALIDADGITPAALEFAHGLRELHGPVSLDALNEFLGERGELEGFRM